MQTIRQFYTVPSINTPELSIHGIGVREEMPPCIVNRPGGTGDYLFMFYYDAVTIAADGVTRDYPPQSLVIWRPQDGHYYGNPSQRWRHSWLHGDGNAIGRLLAENAIPTNQVITLPDASAVEKYLLDCYREVSGQQDPDEIIVRNALHSWLREIKRHVARGDAEVIPARLLEIKRFIEEHYRQPITLALLAERAHLSVPHFCSEFKRHFAVSAIAYLLRVRLHQAAYLLRDRNMSITEIALRVGYADIYHFSKLFKQHYGCSPRAVRKQVDN